MTTKTGLNDLPQSSAWLFPDYEFARMNSHDYANVIIERTLDRASWEQIRWLCARYERRLIRESVQQHGYRRLDKRAFHYWCWMLGITHYRVPPWERLLSKMNADLEPPL